MSVFHINQASAEGLWTSGNLLLTSDGSNSPCKWLCCSMPIHPSRSGSGESSKPLLQGRPVPPSYCYHPTGLWALWGHMSHIARTGDSLHMNPAQHWSLSCLSDWRKGCVKKKKNQYLGERWRYFLLTSLFKQRYHIASGCQKLLLLSVYVLQH